MIYSVTLNSVFPAHHVLLVESLRAAQIIARLLAERFPGMCFSYEKDGAFSRADCHPSIRGCALSFEVQCLVETELKAETDNPHDLPKWQVFFYEGQSEDNDGWQVNAYLDHDRDVIKRCESDPTLKGSTILFAQDPTTADLYQMLAGFRAGTVVE